MTGLDNLRFICRVYDAPIEPAIEFVKEFSELGSYLREPVKKYSSGMRARLAFAISMAGIKPEFPVSSRHRGDGVFPQPISADKERLPSF